MNALIKKHEKTISDLQLKNSEILKQNIAIKSWANWDEIMHTKMKEEMV